MSQQILHSCVVEIQYYNLNHRHTHVHKTAYKLKVYRYHFFLILSIPSMKLKYLPIPIPIPIPIHIDLLCNIYLFHLLLKLLLGGLVKVCHWVKHHNYFTHKYIIAFVYKLSEISAKCLHKVWLFDHH